MSTEGDVRPAIDSGAPVFHPPALELLQRLGGDTLVAEIIDIFTANTPPLLSAARAGAESGDIDAVRRVLHSLKSSAGQLGAARMQRLCSEGELLAAQGAGTELTRLVFGLDAEYAQASARLDEVRRNGLSGTQREGIPAILDER
jgi:two-component system sensor histidine kinase/response regulator